MTAQQIIKWYKENKRELPWRNTRDPYRVWLSEIILQQTRVAQGLPYYEKFVKAFPTVYDLAKAPQQKVLKLWQGLGYYSRARNLHEAAKFVVKECKGIFSSDYEDLKKLKGVGDYTAAAISSFCFGKPHAVVDGNVFRVLSRLYAIDTPINSGPGKKQFTQLANELLDKKDPGTFNQAIMEFGAQYCVPANPDCGNCVLKNKCLVGSTGKASQFPVKAGKTKVRTRHFEYFFISAKGKTFIEKRGAGDIWQGLYQVPMFEFPKKTSKKLIINRLYAEFPKIGEKGIELKAVTGIRKHQLSHQTILARFWQINLTSSQNLYNYTKIDLKNLKKYPFPVLIGNYLREITIFE